MEARTNELTRCEWPWWEPGSGGVESMRGCSVAVPTPSWSRSSGEPGRRRNGEPPNLAPTPYLDLHQMLEEKTPDLVSLCLPNEGPFRDDDEDDRGRIPAPGRETAGLRPRRGRPSACRGTGAFSLLRHQFQPSLRRSRSPGPGRDREWRIGPARLCHLAIRRRGGHERTPSRKSHRDPMSRLRHARAPMWSDRKRYGPDGRQSHRSRQLDHGHRRQILLRRGRESRR